MSLIGSEILAGASGQGGAYEIEQSLRFDRTAPHYLNKTFGSAGSSRKMTISVWLKRAELTSSNTNTGTKTIIGAANTSTGNRDQLRFDHSASGNGDRMSFALTNSSAAIECLLFTDQVFRDTSAWYHVVVAVDTTQATASNRVKIYINGDQVTSFSTETYPSQNFDLLYLNAGGSIVQGIGADPSSSAWEQAFDGYMSEFNFIDGSQLDQYDFGEYDDNGVWRPIKYTGSYTGNSFYLKFASGDGTDSSGLSNTWTANNFTTSGTGTDVMSDTPTTNYATWNGVAIGADATLTNGNLDIAYGSSTTRQGTAATIGVSSGKWYWEVTLNASSISNSVLLIGITKTATPNEIGTYVGEKATDYGYYGNDGTKYNNATATAYGATYAPGDTLGFALDMDAGTCVVYKNNSSQGTLASGLTGTYFPAISDATPANTSSASVNFGQRDFAYTPPTGFKALNTRNTPAPTVKDGSDYFNTVLWTGNATARDITTGHNSNFTWIKHRNSAENHNLYDILRGTGVRLESNSTDKETSYADRLTAFNSDGFSLGTGYNNTTSTTYVGWSWAGGGSGSTNTAGTITSTVSANPSAGFSIVTFTGPGSGTVGHGLGVAPQLILVKNRSITQQWAVYSEEIGNDKFLVLNSTSAASSSNSAWWNSTSPTSTVFSVGTDNMTGGSYNYIAYCFAEVEGYSKFGSYTGNGSSDGPFVYCGFKPAWVMIKESSNADSWLIMDSKRSTYNVVGNTLAANSNGAENVDTGGIPTDFLSNGFKCRGSGGDYNASGDTYIFAAFAEHPTGGSGVSPATAR